jgi:hypothetical protein
MAGTMKKFMLAVRLDSSGFASLRGVVQAFGKDG